MGKNYRDIILKQVDAKKQSFDDLRKAIGIKGEEDIASFSNALEELRNKGELYLDKDGYYHIFDDRLVIKQGQIYIAKNGLGYMRIIESGKEKNYMIKNKDLNGALPKDTVIIRPLDKEFYGHRHAVVEEIIKRDSFFEVYRYMGDGVFVPYELPISMRVIVNDMKSDALVPDTLVLLDVSTKYEVIDNKQYFYGNITKVIGHKDDPKIDEKAVSYKYGFDHKFSNEVMENVNQIPTFVSENEIEDRIDLRDKNIFTIDGKDTKDIDDAISIEEDGDNIILRVSIADVSHYLLKHPRLIEEAIMRGNSAYLADTVIPMLPHQLSNGICSLNPDVDRLAKTVEMVFDKDGNLISSDIYKSVIRSKKQMNYDDVNTLLEAGIIPEGYNDFADDLTLMNKLSTIISKKRNQKGSLNLSDCELKIHTMPDGTPTDIERMYQGKGEKLIENFMIMANIAVTEYYGYLGQPFVYRVHEDPDLTKLKKLVLTLKKQNIIDVNIVNNLLSKIERSIDKNGTIRSCDLGPILVEAEKKDNLDAVSYLLLRAMQKACYSNTNIGHFGLAETDYCHFTSPIRRAADLLNHIIIDLIMEMNYATTIEEIEEIQEKLDMISKKLFDICQHISEREVAADKAEKEVNLIKTSKYLIDNLDIYEGPVQAKITNINKFGLSLLVNDSINAKLDADVLSMYGYHYMRDSRTYYRPKTNDTLNFGTKIYLLDPEVSNNFKLIKYNIPITEEEYEQNFTKSKYKIKRLRRTHTIDSK